MYVMPKSTNQQKLLRDCYQNNVTAEKEALNDVLGNQYGVEIQPAN